MRRLVLCISLAALSLKPFTCHADAYDQLCHELSQAYVESINSLRSGANFGVLSTYIQSKYDLPSDMTATLMNAASRNSGYGLYDADSQQHDYDAYNAACQSDANATGRR